MKEFPCPYLGVMVELTDEREQHISETHPDLVPAYLQQMADTLANPDQVQVSRRSESSRLFVRWHDSIKGGK